MWSCVNKKGTSSKVQCTVGFVKIIVIVINNLLGPGAAHNSESAHIPKYFQDIDAHRCPKRSIM